MAKTADTARHITAMLEAHGARQQHVRVNRRQPNELGGP